jgi:hypothetical protein
MARIHFFNDRLPGVTDGEYRREKLYNAVRVVREISRICSALGSAAAFFESIAVLGNVVPNAINDQRIV